MNRETLNYQCYLQSQNFIDSKGFSAYWKKMYDFYNGDQYPKSAKNDINMPKPVTNICGFSVDSKASKICGTPFALNFTIFDNTKSTINLSNFDKYNLNRLKEDEANYVSCSNGLIYGTEIYYYRWDKDNTTVDGRYSGGLAGEHIEPEFFRVANPTIGDIQKQEWVMFFSSESVGAIRDLVEDKKKKEMIVPDGYTYQELSDLSDVDICSKRCFLFTRFFRVDGEVYFQMSTRDVDITEPIPMNPKLRAKKLKVKENNGDESNIEDYEEIDKEDTTANISDRKLLTAENYKKIKSKFALYPFAIYCPKPLRRSLYGKSEIEEMIPNQKYINQLDSMVLLDAMNSGMGKTIVKDDSLKGQKITNDPRQMLVDHHKGNDFGIKRLEGSPMNTSVVNYNDLFIQRTRNISGVDEISPSVATTKNLSGVAIQLINEEKNTRIEQAQRRFWDFCVDKAYVRLMFYKFYYQKIEYTVELSDDELKKEQLARVVRIKQDRANGLNINPMEYPEAKREQVREFNPSDIREDSFDIAIEAGRGTRYSEIVVADMMNQLVIGGGLQNMDTHTKELFFELYPLIPPSFKTNFKSIIERQKRDEISQLTNVITQAQQKMEQLLQYTASLENKLGVQSEYTKNLEKEFTNKINAQNDIIKAQNKVISNNPSGAKSSANVSMPSASNYVE